jgi:hypothetical protein
MMAISDEEIREQVFEQAITIAPDLNKEIYGIYNVKKQYEIYYKYTSKMLNSLPETTVSTIREALKAHGSVDFNRVPVEPIHAFLLDTLQSAILDLVEFDSDSYESLTHQLQCESASQPWFDPDDEIWMNRSSEDEEFTLKERFIKAGKLDDYLDGETEITVD